MMKGPPRPRPVLGLFSSMDFHCFAAICLAAVIAVGHALEPIQGELNAECKNIIECNNVYNVQRYFCSRNRTCQCLPHYVPNRSFQKCVGLLEERCKYDDQCIEGAYCKDNKRCECKEGLIPSYDRLECSNSPNVSKHRSISIVYLLPLLLIILK